MSPNRPKRIKNIVCEGTSRKYYRFRSAKFYGGIATADCVGCNLNCAFCWSKEPRKNPRNIGKFYSPERVADKLENIAKKQEYQLMRLSGNEPTIGKQHLLRLLELLPRQFRFILETNGVLLDEQYVKELSRFRHLHVRVSLKAGNPDIFSKVTGAPEQDFEKPLHALRLLEKYGLSYHVSVVKDMLTPGDLSFLKEKLADLHPGFELESLKYYPHVKEEMKQRGMAKFIKK